VTPYLTKRMRQAVLRNLTKARALIESGWVKGTEHRIRYDGTHAYCMIGAIKKADGSGEARAMKIVGDIAAQMFPRRNNAVLSYGASRIWRVNDSRSTKKDDVLAIFDKAIASLQDGAGQA